MSKNIAVALAAAGLLLSGAASATTVTFDNESAGQKGTSYTVDGVLFSRNGSGNTLSIYSDCNNSSACLMVGSPNNQYSEILMIKLPNAVSQVSFDFGLSANGAPPRAWIDGYSGLATIGTLVAELYVPNLGWTNSATLQSEKPFTFVELFALGDWTNSSVGLWIDNLSFTTQSITTVSEPKTYALLLAALGVMAWVSRRGNRRTG